jgi:SAM-dependent methyltransferase
MRSKKSTEVTSSHYSGVQGEEYFAWQNQNGDRNGKIESRKFLSWAAKNKDLLDFGCGAGNLLANLPGKSKIGIEINPIAIQSARSQGLNVISSIEDVASSSIDLAVSNHALEHVPYPVASLSELFRVLRPDGALKICVPIDDWRFQKKFDPQNINNHLYTWTPQLLGNCLVEAGFDAANVEISIISHSWFPGTKFLWKRKRLFDFFCHTYSRITRRGRQIMAVATK